jgi:hypothetical protein
MTAAEKARVENTHISVFLPRWLQIELAALAARNDRSFSAEVRVGLLEHVSTSIKGRVMGDE